MLVNKYPARKRTSYLLWKRLKQVSEWIYSMKCMSVNAVHVASDIKVTSW